VKLGLEQEATKRLELELKKKQMASDGNESGETGMSGANSGIDNAKGPKMASFDEEDDVDS